MGKIYLLRIDNMAFGGDGVGTISASEDESAAGSEVEGIRCFVPFSAPGDLLRVEIVKRKKRFLRGRIVEIVEASPHRKKPECPLFGLCGGCTLQHIEYTEQLEAKRNILVQNLRRLGSLDAVHGSLEKRVEAAASPREYGYRRRVRMRISPEGRPAFATVPAESRAGSGITESRAGSLVEIPHCPVATTRINRIIRSVYNGEMSFPAGSTLLIQEADGEVQWEVEGAGEEEIGFFQVNEEVNRSLVEELLREARGSISAQASISAPKNVKTGDTDAAGKEGKTGSGDLSSLRVLDLFCGNGNLSLPLAAAGARVVGYDRSEGSIKKTKNTSAADKLTSYKKMDVKKAVRRIEQGNIRPFGNQKPNLILLDPPRSGMGEEEMSQLYRIGVEKILYVSCDPATLSRDLKKSSQEGYQLERAVGFDMFPQTSHFETLAVLKIL